MKMMCQIMLEHLKESRFFFVETMDKILTNFPIESLDLDLFLIHEENIEKMF